MDFEALENFEVVDQGCYTDTSLVLVCSTCKSDICNIEDGDTLNVLASHVLNHKCEVTA